MITDEQLKFLEEDRSARYAEWLKADQKAFASRMKNRKAERAFKDADEKERYDKRDLLKADPVLGGFMVKQTIHPLWQAWCDAEDEMLAAESESKQAAIRVDEVIKRIEIYKIAVGLV